MITSCVHTTGKLQVHNEIDINQKLILPGSYKAQIYLNKRKRVKIKVKSNNEKINIKINIPKERPLPEFNLSKIHQNCLNELKKCNTSKYRTVELINYSSKETDFSYDLEGKVIVTRTRELQYIPNEPCRIIPNLHECRRYNEDDVFFNSNSMCRGTPGTRPASYYLYKYSLSLVLSFTQENEIMATLNTQDSDKFKEYIYKGTCSPEKI